MLENVNVTVRTCSNLRVKSFRIARVSAKDLLEKINRNKCYSSHRRFIKERQVLYWPRSVSTRLSCLATMALVSRSLAKSGFSPWKKNTFDNYLFDSWKKEKSLNYIKSTVPCRYTGTNKKRNMCAVSGSAYNLHNQSHHVIPVTN